MPFIRMLQLTTSVAAIALITGVAMSSPAVSQSSSSKSGSWTAEERTTLASLSLAVLEPLPADPSNKYADNAAAAQLGMRLFADTRLSSNGRVSCATCHVPTKEFQDDLPLGKGVGTAGRRTMPIAGTAYSPWQFWDGRADSQWAQALGPLESPAEHAGNRRKYAAIIATHYRNEFRAVFGATAGLDGDISRVYANIGKAIAAYERKIVFTPARFDRFVSAELSGQPHTIDNDFTPDERAGLHLFIGKANCSTCHTGALFTDNHFHNTAVPQSRDGTPNDSGRTSGVRKVTASEFNCLSRYSDAKPEECAELRFAVTEGTELVRAFKTPSLRNAVNRSPFMHAGQFASMDAVLDHYNRAPRAPFGKSELKSLHLSKDELKQLDAFLRTLVSPIVYPRLDDSKKYSLAVPTRHNP